MIGTFAAGIGPLICAHLRVIHALNEVIGGLEELDRRSSLSPDEGAMLDELRRIVADAIPQMETLA